MTLYTCPVLAFTPEVEQVFEWFRSTYAIEGGFGWVQWVRRTLPYAGGLADQPARLIESLEYVAEMRNALIARDLKPKRRERGRRETRG